MRPWISFASTQTAKFLDTGTCCSPSQTLPRMTTRCFESRRYVAEQPVAADQQCDLRTAFSTSTERSVRPYRDANPKRTGSGLGILGRYLRPFSHCMRAQVTFRLGPHHRSLRMMTTLSSVILVSRTGLLKLQRNSVITVGVIFKHGIETTLIPTRSGPETISLHGKFQSRPDEQLNRPQLFYLYQEAPNRSLGRP